MPAPIAVPGRDDVRVVVSHRLDGDFNLKRVPADELVRRRRQLVDLPWTQLQEEHGTDCVVVEYPGAADGDNGDVLATAVPGTVLGVWTGDCAPVCLVGDRAIVVVHAGWRGLRDGVLEAAVDAMARMGDVVRSAVIGPHIGPCCYEFGRTDLDEMKRLFGPGVESLDSHGRPALDVEACITAGLRASVGRDVTAHIDPACTGCDDSLFFSHRRRGEVERHVMAVWIETPESHPMGGG